MTDPLVQLARDTIHNCTSCPLHVDVTLPVPFSPPKANVAVAVIGEAPGEAEDRDNEPFVGPGGQLLRRVLNNVGAGNYILMNSICCRPPNDRTPKSSEVFACRDNYNLQLAVADPKILLLLGATALSTWRQDLRLSKVHGRVGKWDERWIVLTYHPSYVLRNKDVYPEFVANVRLAFTLVHKGNKTKYLSLTCSNCSNDVHYYDRDLMAWCEKCWHPSLASREFYVQGTLL